MLMDAAKKLKPFPEEAKTATNRVMGCTAQVRTLVVDNFNYQLSWGGGQGDAGRTWGVVEWEAG